MKLVVAARGARLTHLLCCVCVKAVRCQLGVNTCCCVVNGGCKVHFAFHRLWSGGRGGGRGGVWWGGGGSTHFAVQRVRRKRQKLKPKTNKNPFARAFRISRLGSGRLRFRTGCCITQAEEIRLKTEKKDQQQQNPFARALRISTSCHALQVQKTKRIRLQVKDLVFCKKVLVVYIEF